MIRCEKAKIGKIFSDILSYMSSMHNCAAVISLDIFFTDIFESEEINDIIKELENSSSKNDKGNVIIFTSSVRSNDNDRFFVKPSLVRDNEQEYTPVIFRSALFKDIASAFEPNTRYNEPVNKLVWNSG